MADAERKEIARLQKEVREQKLSRWDVYPVLHCTPAVRQDIRGPAPSRMAIIPQVCLLFLLAMGPHLQAQDEARRQLEERMKRDMEVRTAMAQQL